MTATAALSPKADIDASVLPKQKAHEIHTPFFFLQISKADTCHTRCAQGVHADHTGLFSYPSSSFTVPPALPKSI